MTPNKQKLIERLINGGDDLFTSFVIAGLEENLEIIYDEVKKILSMDRIPDHRMDDLIALRADGEATILILQYYGAGDYPVAAELMAKAHLRIHAWECYLRATEQPDMSQEDDTEVQPNPALKEAQERTKEMLTEARMSNDLAKRLRETTYMHQVDCELKMSCADRIEELEAKLAKAVEHFKKLRRRQDCLETFDLVVHEITETALAELTGGSADD